MLTANIHTGNVCLYSIENRTRTLWELSGKLSLFDVFWYSLYLLTAMRLFMNYMTVKRAFSLKSIPRSPILESVMITS